MLTLFLTAMAADLDRLQLLQTQAVLTDDELISDVDGQTDDSGDERPLVSPDDCKWDKTCCMYRCNNWQKTSGWYKGMAKYGWDHCEIRSMSFKQGELFFNKQASGTCGGLGSVKAKCPERLIGRTSGNILQQVKRFTEVVSGKLTARDCSKDPDVLAAAAQAAQKAAAAKEAEAKAAAKGQAEKEEKKVAEANAKSAAAAKEAAEAKEKAEEEAPVSTACKSWCGSKKHAETDWAVRCSWSGCAKCDECGDV